jgi:hypothetical protein
MDADGSNLIRVADSSYTGEPQWSPDGTKIIYEGRDDNIWVVNADGTGDPVRIPTPTTYQTHASVMNAHEADGSFRTNLEVELSGYPGNLPDELIDLTITLKRPDGSQSVLKSYALAPTDFTYFPQWNSFFVALEGSPEIGLYEFTVETVFDTRTDRDAQQRLYTIPNPDISSFSPANGESVSSKTPLFSWAPLVIDDPDAPSLFYRLEVNDMTGNRVWASGRSEGMTACSVPQGRLTPGETYQWRVRVTDSSDWLEVQNRANSEWTTFSVADTLTHNAPPALDIDSWGVSTWSGYWGTGLDLEIKVIDQDGVAYDGSSHTVSVETPTGDGGELSFYWAQGARGSYGYWADGYLEPGTYTFTVTDPDGNTATVQDVVEIDPIDPPIENAIFPSNMDKTITTQFDNVYVNGDLYEDFSSYADISELDQTKWSWSSADSCQSIVDERLQEYLPPSVGRSTCRVAVANSESVTSIKTDVTITGVAGGEDARARLKGNFYFNGHADVGAQVAVSESQVFYNVWEDTESSVISWKDLARGQLMAVSPGDTVTISISWDGNTFTFTAADATEPETIYSASYTAPGLVAPSINGHHIFLESRTYLVSQDTSPTFTWAPATGAERYRLRIYNTFEDRTVWSGYTGETSYTVPPGALQPDSFYKFRVQAYDAHSNLDIDNAAGTNRYEFYTGTVESPVPHIEFDSSGVQTWNGNNIDPYLSFWVNVHDAQGVPGNIRSVKVQFPDSGQIIDLLHDTSRDPSPTSGYYRNDVFIDPTGMDGIYTFIVEDWDGNRYQATEALTVDPIGYPEPANFEVTVTGTALDVDWDDVDGAAFYRLEIYDERFKRLHAFATTESHYSVPEGVLKAGTLYRYRVTTRREFFDQNVDNGSSSPWSMYDRPTFVTAPDAGSNAPLVDLDGYGVAVWHTQNAGASGDTWLLGFSVKATDADGVPENIENVSVTFPDGITTRDLAFDSRLSSTEGTFWVHDFYEFWEDIPDGTYTFTVTDYNGLSAHIDDVLVKNDLPVPQNCQPASGTTLLDATPVISWDSVSGAASYRVRIYEGIDTTRPRPAIRSGRDGGIPFPPGLLVAGKTYNYRVYAYREDLPRGGGTDNRLGQRPLPQRAAVLHRGPGHGHGR